MAWRTRRQVRSQPSQEYAEDALQELLDVMDTRMQRINEEYLRRMGTHIREIGKLWPSDVHRLQQIRRMNKNLQALEAEIGRAAGKTAREIEDVFEDIAQYDARMATRILGVSDTIRVSDNEPLRRILRAQARETARTMLNLSNTTVVSRFYRSAVDASCTAVQTGVQDYNSAIRNVIRDAGQHGLRVTDEGTTKVVYESGYSRRLDSAARMNVLDGVRHLNQSVMEEVAEQFGANGVEIDAHMLCAEDHLPYQGGQYSNEEFEQIQDSLQRPFGEWNCRHSWHGIILGVSPPTYTPEQLEEMRQYSTEEITIDGRTKTRYEWSQEMRRCEVRVRQMKDCANLARATGDESLRQRCQGQITELNKYYRELAGKAGIGAEYRRTYVAGFRDVAEKAAMARGDAVGQWPAGGQSISREAYQELKAYAQEKGIQLKSFEKFDGDVSLIKDFIDRMDEVSKDFPEVRSAFKGGLQLVNNYHMSPDDYASAGKHSSININAAAFRNREALEKDYAERVAAHWFASGTTYQSIAYHEMGHVIHNAIKFSLHKAVGDTNTRKISIYAATSIKEGVAETVSAIYSGSSLPEVLTIWRRCGTLIAERRR